MNINLIKAAGANDFLRTNRYRVFITNPITGSLDQNSSMNCVSCDFPGCSFGTYDKRTKGPIWKLPNDRIYTEVNLAFYVDSNATTRKYFQAWQDGITSGDNFKFFSDYKGEIIIQEFTRDGNVAQTATIQDVYPVIISPITLSYDNKNQVEIVQISFNQHKNKIK